MHPSPSPWSSDQGDQDSRPSDQPPQPTEQISYSPPQASSPYEQPPAAPSPAYGPPQAYGSPYGPSQGYGSPQAGSPYDPSAGPPPPAGPYGPPPYGPPPYGPGGGYRPPPPGGNRRTGVIIAVVVAAAVLLCGGSVTAAAILIPRSSLFDEASGPDPSPGSPPTSDPAEPFGPITWWPLEQEFNPIEAIWTDLAEDFATETGAEVTIETHPRDIFEDALATYSAGGRAPDLHYTAGGAPLRRLVEQNLVRDITDDLADIIGTLPPATLDPYTFDGRVYGLPYHGGISGIWYNKSLFTEAGLDPENPPTSWQGFMDAVSALKGSGVAPIAIAGGEDWTVHFWYSYLAVRAGGAAVIEEAKQDRSFDHPDLLRAAELLEELVAREPFQSGFESAPYVGPFGQASAISTEEAAMELMGDWAPSVYEGENGGLGDDLGWFPFPAVPGGAGDIGDVVGHTDGFAVAIDAPLNTLDLLEFLYRDGRYDQLITTENSGVLPVTPDAPAPPGHPLLTTQVTALHTAPSFQLYLDQDLPRPVGDALRSAMADLLMGRVSAGEAVARITDAYQRESD